MREIDRRIKADLEGMEKLRERCQGLLNFSVSNFNRSYNIRLNGIETYIGTTRNNKRKVNHINFNITLVPEYPIRGPLVRFSPAVFHPNCYSSGVYCYTNAWSSNISLSEFLIDLVNQLQFKTANPRSPGNSDASQWYISNKDRISALINQIHFPPPLRNSEEMEISDLDLDLESTLEEQRGCLEIL